MRIDVLLDPKRLARWHLWLLEDLRARGLTQTTVSFADTPAPTLPPALGLLLDLEHLTGRASGESAIDPLSPDDPGFAAASQFGAAADLRIDLRDIPFSPAAGPLLVPLYNGEPGMAALWSAVLDGRAPLISVAQAGKAAIPVALPAIEDPLALRRAATQVLARVVEAIANAASDLAAGRNPAPPGGQPVPDVAPATRGSAAGFARSLIEGKARSALSKRLRNAPRWAVAHRPAADGRTHPPSPLDINRFSLLLDDGQRYFADPFLFENGGQLHLFVEELPYSTGRGLISHAVLGPDGHFSRPRQVLERPYHLSYPQMFARDGQIWMLPETAASGAIELYRAERFPDHWELAARLIDGRFHDATLFEHGGRLWITAGSECRGSATWDGLSLFHAERLDGPWTPHPLNPVLVDARAARPAGEVYRAGGELWRPAQNCIGGYGSALSLACVTKLDLEGFAQKTITTFRLSGRGSGTPAREARLLGPHTINWAAGIEVIDLFTPPSWRPGA